MDRGPCRKEDAVRRQARLDLQRRVRSPDGNAAGPGPVLLSDPHPGPEPFGIGELLARIRVALRHAMPSEPTPTRQSFGPIVLDLEYRQVLVDGEAVHLTPKEFELFALLAANANKVVTHRQALTQVWGPAHHDDVQYLRVVIAQLRAKLEADAKAPKHLLSEAGVGYRLVQ